MYRKYGLLLASCATCNHSHHLEPCNYSSKRFIRNEEKLVMKKVTEVKKTPTEITVIRKSKGKVDIVNVNSEEEEEYVYEKPTKGLYIIPLT